jgi:molybdopterin-binding protein
MHVVYTLSGSRAITLPHATTIPLIAEVAEASTTRLGLREGKLVYATFKATEARAYI